MAVGAASNTIDFLVIHQRLVVEAGSARFWCSTIGRKWLVGVSGRPPWDSRLFSITIPCVDRVRSCRKIPNFYSRMASWSQARA